MFQKPQQTKITLLSQHLNHQHLTQILHGTETRTIRKNITIIFTKPRVINAMPEVVSSANVCIRFNGLKYTVVQFLSKQQHVIIIYSLNSLLIHSQKIL